MPWVLVLLAFGLALLLALVWMTGLAAGRDARLSWDLPDVRTDGSPLGPIRGFRVDYGAAPGALDRHVVLADAETRELRVRGLDDGDWYFRVSVVDHDGSVVAPSALQHKRVGARVQRHELAERVRRAGRWLRARWNATPWSPAEPQERRAVLTDPSSAA